MAKRDDEKEYTVNVRLVVTEGELRAIGAQHGARRINLASFRLWAQAQVEACVAECVCALDKREEADADG